MDTDIGVYAGRFILEFVLPFSLRYKSYMALIDETKGKKLSRLALSGSMCDEIVWSGIDIQNDD